MTETNRPFGEGLFQYAGIFAKNAARVIRGILSSFSNLDGSLVLLWFLAFLKIALHLLTNHNYGLHRDELLYSEMGNHLQWGYWRTQPFVAVMAYLSPWMPGEGLFQLRFLAALAGGLTVLFSGLLTRAMGGGRFAQSLTAVAVIIAPVFLRQHTLLQPAAFETFFWLLGTYLVVLWINDQATGHWWLVIGLVAGLGFLNSHSMAFWAFLLIAGLLLTQHRRVFLSPWPWLGALVAILVVLPNVTWQQQAGLSLCGILNMPFFSMHEPFYYRSDLLLEQFLIVHPVTAVIWLAGLYFFFFRLTGKPYQLFGWMYLGGLLLLLYDKGNGMILAPFYPLLFAAGAIYIEQYIRRNSYYWIKAFLIMNLLVWGTLTAPYGLPLLPVNILEIYCGFLAKYGGLESPLRTDSGEMGKIPQDFAEMFGWPEQVEALAGVYRDLDADDRQSALIWARNYGQAGAVSYFDSEQNLPRVICRYRDLPFWQPDSAALDTSGFITIGYSLDELRPYFGFIRIKKNLTIPLFGNVSESFLIYYCRKPSSAFYELWHTGKFIEGAKAIDTNPVTPR